MIRRLGSIYSGLASRRARKSSPTPLSSNCGGCASHGNPSKAV
jgi:hypothetical protein